MMPGVTRTVTLWIATALQHIAVAQVFYPRPPQQTRTSARTTNAPSGQVASQRRFAKRTAAKRPHPSPHLNPHLRHLHLNPHLRHLYRQHQPQQRLTSARMTSVSSHQGVYARHFATLSAARRPPLLLHLRPPTLLLPRPPCQPITPSLSLQYPVYRTCTYHRSSLGIVRATTTHPPPARQTATWGRV